MKFKKKEKEKKSERMEPVSKEETLQTIKTDKFMKIGRIVLWVVILFLLVRGIASVVAPGSEIKMQEMITDYQAEAKLRETIQVGAAAFAQDFAYEYYTFSGKYDSDYEQRLKRYLGTNTEVKSPMGNKYSSTVIFATTQEITVHNAKEYDIDVHLQVKYSALTNEMAGGTGQNDIYIRVPVTSDGKGNYAVVSSPSYIPEEKTAKIKGVDAYKGLQVENSRIAPIKETLNSFLAVYFGGTANEISYYLTADSNIDEAASGMVEYQKLDYATVSQDEVSKDYLIEAKFTVSDHGQMIQQKAFIRMKYAKNHYYIKSMNTRPM